MSTSSVRAVDINLDLMTELSLFFLVSLGTKRGIFSALSKRPLISRFMDDVGIPNRRLLSRFLTTLNRLGIARTTNDHLELVDFSHNLVITKDRYSALVPDWASVLEEIYKMVDYAFITPTHPQILMDFDKDADFWDMRMSTSFSSLYRQAIAEVAGIKAGMSVLDIGCGSVSPAYFGRLVGYNGFYLGLDYSYALLDIARTRIAGESLPVVLKEMDATLIRPVNSYDVVIMSFFLEYVQNRRRILKNALEGLKRGGKLVIVDPFRDRFKYVHALEFFESLNRDFVGFPSVSEIKEIVSSLDFEVSVKSPGRSFLLLEKL
ncbi:class I SAM-dependent methyltransferase [Thermococcus stetteri]|uniref:class I SAM-dependent methyltransferase n=1 Tax=Thermococcus stetteri TaxID=49900 RepID=UPI001AE4A171|nr:class I SAM-dependent methyltransferase [Thermococcus stetteri]MBP1910935.1 ubiquinone/menaquinone biosynthesis C-methylase UbiE [Thermococcus stetteri]